MKGIVAVVVIGLVGWMVFTFLGQSETLDEATEEIVEEVEDVFKLAQNGTYKILPEESKLNWSGRKPLIKGYINRGGFEINEGSIVFEGASSTGGFVIDVSTLSVSETKAKPGSESLLEKHLKSDLWFNVEEFPTAEFSIMSAIPHEDVETTFLYDIVGNLTMKGLTNEISFPAKIYENKNGNVVVESDFEIDRTLWGITANSSLFFDNLADQVIDDMIKLSLNATFGRVIEIPSEDIEEEISTTTDVVVDTVEQ